MSDHEYSGDVGSTAYRIASLLDDGETEWIAGEAADLLIDLIDRMITERLGGNA